MLKLHRARQLPTKPCLACSRLITRSIDDAASRALDYYLKLTPKDETSDKPYTIFCFAPDIDSECLLANLSETLASANAMISDLAFGLVISTFRES
ncbi:DUF6124 family protein [Pseudomonas fluorescens]|uniref:DUF6124 family protein n=1 Tax=Pseudomonas TaxID=286 RepID=UPI00269D46B4